MVCFDSLKTRILPDNDLNFTAEIIKFPGNYLMKNSIFNIE